MVLILLKEQFDDSFVLPCKKIMQKHGLRVVLVGLQAGRLTGYYGQQVRPDWDMLDNASQFSLAEARLVVLPGRVHHTTQLLLDARIHPVIHTTLKQGGYLALPSHQAQTRLHRSGLPLAPYQNQILTQNEQDNASFIQYLLSCETNLKNNHKLKQETT